MQNCAGLSGVCRGLCHHSSLPYRGLTLHPGVWESVHRAKENEEGCWVVFCMLSQGTPAACDCDTEMALPDALIWSRGDGTDCHAVDLEGRRSRMMEDEQSSRTNDLR